MTSKSNLMKKTNLWLTVVFFILQLAVNAQTIKGTFAIQNVKTGINVRIKDANSKNGTPIVAYSPENWKCETWDFKQQDDKTYLLANLFSGKTIQPISSPIPGTTLNEQPIDASSSLQRYEFIPMGKETYLIKLKGTDLYLTPGDDQGETNAPLKLAHKIEGNLQFWTLIEQHPTI